MKRFIAYLSVFGVGVWLGQLLYQKKHRWDRPSYHQAYDKGYCKGFDAGSQKAKN